MTRSGTVGHRPGSRYGRLTGTVGSWRAALRIARREALRARGRTALVLTMIALPVLALSFAAVSVDMGELTRAEQIDRRLGAADAELTFVSDTALHQNPWGTDWRPRAGEAVGRNRPGTLAEVTDLLPAGSRASPVRWWTSLTVDTGDRVETFEARALDLADPLARGPGRLLSGRAPAAADEVAPSRAAQRRLGVGHGDRITGGGRTFTVVGTVEFADGLGVVFALHPSAVPPGPVAGPQVTWLVDLPAPPDADLVDRLNRHGVTITAREPVPGAVHPTTPAPDLSSSLSAEQTGNVVLVAGLGLLEVVLLVGPAFAVGVRRRRRDLALVAVAGGDPRHLRRIVLADGVVLGCAGAVTGVVLGVAAALAGRPLVEQYLLQQRMGGYRIWPEALALIAGVAVTAGVLAALAPAWTAARQDVVAGLAGRRTTPPHRRRWLVVGVLLVGGGTAIAATGAARSVPTVLLVGLVLGELGLVCCTPTLLGAIARAGRALPLAPRIAVRDASRNRSSAAPAVSAVLAAVAGSVALGSFLASDEARGTMMYPPPLPPGRVVVYHDDLNAPAGRGARLDPAQVSRAARTHLGTDQVVPLTEANCPGPSAPVYCTVTAVLPPDRVCPYQPGDDLGAAAQRRARADPRCQGPAWRYRGSTSLTVIDDGTALTALTDAGPAEAAAATAVLRAGGAVVNDPRYLHNGRLTVRVVPEDRGVGRSAVLPGYVLPGADVRELVLLSPAAARQLGLVAFRSGSVVTADPGRTQRDWDRFTAALDTDRPVHVEVSDPGRSGNQSMLLLLAAAAGVITIGAAGVATGLAAAESRADLSTLAAVGASPRVRRLLSLCQAGVISGVGTVLGVVAGLGTAAIILVAMNRRYATAWPIEPGYPLLVPWTTLGILVAVPLVAMLGAALFTRSRLAVERRLD
ncbi:FtsX-like permease family protein [Micromonospora rosaria]|uniref:FtsX-like permease family protein n=3 Tax=Micromonospora rosaria TaxID=47874 RepID=UPI0037C52BA9